MTRCTHLDQVRDVAPHTPAGCEECLATGEPGERWGWCYVDQTFLEEIARP